MLRDLYGLRYTEVSAALGMSVASVESLLFRARRSLRVSLKPLASGALIVPVAIREGIAQALPGFTTAGAAGGGAASGAVGLGLLAKFTGVPVALKVAAGVVAVTTAGSVAVVGAEHAAEQHPTTLQTVSQPHTLGATAPTAKVPVAGPSVPVFDRPATSAAGDDGTNDHTGASGRGRGEDRDATSGGTTGGSKHEGSDSSSSASSGHAEDVGSARVRSDGHVGARTDTGSGDDDGKSGSQGSHHRSESGDAKAPVSGDALLSTHAPHPDSESPDGASTKDGSSSADGSESSDDSHPAKADEPSDDSPETTMTAPPPA